MSVNSFIALIGACGVLLVWMAISHPLAIRLDWLQRPRLAREAAEMRGKEFEGLSIFAHKPILDRALAGTLEELAGSLGGLLRRSEEDEKLILQAGRPRRYRTLYDLYAWKVLFAAMFFVMGIIPAALAGRPLLILAPLLGFVGFLLPDYHLRQLVRRRQELLRTELAFTLHRIAIHVAAGRALPVALRQVVSGPGGLFVAELRRVMTDYDTGVPLRDALQGMLERNPGVGALERFVDLIDRTTRHGQPIAETMSAMGRTLQQELEAEVEARGMATSVKMVLPVGLLVLPAIGIVVMGPAVLMAARFFF